IQLGEAYIDACQPAKALALLEKFEQQAIDKEDYLLLEVLASCYLVNRKPDKAIPFFEKVLAKQLKLLGAQRLETKSLQYDLAAAYLTAGQRDKAMPLLKQMVEGYPKVRYDADVPELLFVLAKRFTIGSLRTDFGKAIALFEQAIELQMAKRGP